MVKVMASDPQLIKNWIQYLKNNQIAGMQSDPKTGKLKYRRPVTADDLYKFLDTTGNFDSDTIKNAIDSVVSKKIPVRTSPEQKSAPTVAAPIERQPKPHYKLSSPTHAGQKPKVAYKGLREDIQDFKGAQLDEKDVEEVFNLLDTTQKQDTTPAQSAQQGQQARQGQSKQKQPEPPAEKVEAKKQENIKKIKRLIRDTMSPAQRATLWRSLNEQ